MLVEAAFTASKISGPLRAFYQRVPARCRTQIAIVATARKLVCLCWTMIERGENYAFARQSLTEKKLRALELRAGLPPHRGRKGTAANYSLKDVRRRELELAQQAEHAYRQQVADWHARGPSKPGVAAANGTRLKRPSAGQAARQASVPEPALRSGVDHALTQA
jgi:transposase